MDEQPIFMAGSDCTHAFDLVDEVGQFLNAVSYSYTLYDETGSQVTTGSGAVASGFYTLEVEIAATHNQVVSDTRMGARQIVVIVTDADGDTHRFTEIYLLRNQVFLKVPAESGQTVMEAMLLARGFTPALMESWNFSDEVEREAALIEAWTRISRMALDPFRREDTPADALPEVVKQARFAINELTNAEWLLLPKHFREAVKRAQLVEAAVLLGGDPTWERRADGLISRTVGESSEMFRSKPPIMGSLSPKATRELAGYMVQTMRIERG